ncbi:MAG: cytidylate kinase-like family protein [Candidatus Eremiobacteraeota bacterium]|nr:cytidylate kinase-like family protein [Candidatus Eremiobacteraeota bacterium]
MIVTISSEYGSGGLGAGRIAAQRLGYKFVDQQLPVVVAARLGTSRAAVNATEGASATVSERILRVLELGTPEVNAAQVGVTFDEECVREVQQAVRDFAARGNCIIIGRGGSAILGRRRDVLRVFAHAPREWRIHRLVDGHGVDAKTATSEVDRIDRARREYMRAYYELDWGTPANYDLSVDVSSFGDQGTAELIVRAAESRT